MARRLDNVSLSLIRQVFEKARPGAINLGLGEPAFATAPEILDAARRELDGGRLGYTFNGGMAELRALIAECSAGDWNADNVCVTVGANGGLLASMLATVDPGDDVLVPDPGFPSYAAAASIAGARPVAYLMAAADGFRVDVEAIRAVLTENTRAIVINSPSNPTGSIITADQLQSLAQLAEEHDLTVISDEVYGQFHYTEPTRSFAAMSRRGLVVNSLSKTESMTGWRLGWVVGSADRIKAITALNQHSVTCAPTLSQRVALTALGPGVAARTDNTRADFARRRQVMLDVIRTEMRMPCIEPDGAFFVMLEAAPDGETLALSLDILDKTNVITVPGVAFGKQAASYLRLSFAASEEDIREGVRRLAAYF